MSGGTLVFVFVATHPKYPNMDLIEVEAPDYARAVMTCAEQMPGIHLHKLLGTYILGTRGEA